MSNTTTAVDAMRTMPLSKVPSVRHLLMNDNARSQLAAVAAKHMNPERMMRVVANAIRSTPKLQECDPISFLGALMHCASLGLEPNTPLGHAYLIPFEVKRKIKTHDGKEDWIPVKEVQVVIGYKGFIDLARRTGQLAAIHGDVVYDDDELWSHEYGSNQHLRHKPGPRKGKRLGAYCYVKLNLGEGMTAEGHRFMSMDEIIRHRNTHSQGWKTAVKFNKTAESPWNEANPAFEAMAIKTVVRALANRGELPMSIEFMEALESDESRGDYRQFAMDPNQGLTIEADAEEAPPPEEDRREPQKVEVEKPKVEVTPKAEKAEAKPRASAPRREDPPPAEPEQAGLPLDEEEPDIGRDPVWGDRIRQIRGDIPSGEEAVWDMWSAELNEMKESAPEVFALLMQEIAAAENG